MDLLSGHAMETEWNRAAILMLTDDDQAPHERKDIRANFRDRREMKSYGECIGGIVRKYGICSLPIRSGVPRPKTASLRDIAKSSRTQYQKATNA